MAWRRQYIGRASMSNFYDTPFGVGHDHVFLGADHERNERKTWMVIALCSAMMVAEIGGGTLFGSLALVADGLHMSTHAGAMLIAALAYTYARKHAKDRRFVFGTGKMGDLAGFSSAIILAMIALLIGYEAVARLLAPVPIHYSEAIPIAIVGLLVNVASAWMLSGDDHHHGHSHGGHVHGPRHHHGHTPHGYVEHGHGDEAQRIFTSGGIFALSIFEKGTPPVFRLHALASGSVLPGQEVTVTTIRPDDSRQVFACKRVGDYLESTSGIPEPHTFTAVVHLPDGEHTVVFEEHGHEDEHHVDHHDHNMRAAFIHVIADAAVSVLTIIGLLLAKSFGWVWMDPVAGIVGALVIANWSYGLIRDTSRNLLDISPDERMAGKVKAALEASGDDLVDLHVWRLGPGHLGVVASILSQDPQRGPEFYHSILHRFKGLSHVTVEVHTPQLR